MSRAAIAEDEQLRRLRWQCRRGMLELDHLLSRFLDRGFAELDDSGRALLTEMLREQDQDLHNWLISLAEPPPDPFKALVTRIREVGRSRRHER